MPVLQIASFAGVGVVATLVHVFVALVSASVFQLEPQAANAAGFASAVTLSYLGQGRLTFRRELKHSFHAPRFLLTALLGLVLSSAITEGVVTGLDAPFAVAMAIVAVAVPVTTYTLCRFWVFRSAET